MKRTEMLQEVRKMRFEEIYGTWTERHLTQEEAGVHRYIDGTLSLFHWHRKLAEYDSEGQLKRKETEKTAVQSQSRHISSKTGKALRATPPVPFLLN